MNLSFFFEFYYIFCLFQNCYDYMYNCHIEIKFHAMKLSLFSMQNLRKKRKFYVHSFLMCSHMKFNAITFQLCLRFANLYKSIFVDNSQSFIRFNCIWVWNDSWNNLSFMFCWCLLYTLDWYSLIFELNVCF